MKAFLKLGIVWLVAILCQPLFVQMEILAEENPKLTEIQEWIDRADSLHRAEDFDSAIVVAKITLEKIEREYGKSDSLYTRVLIRLGDFYYRETNFIEAVRYYERWLDSIEKDLWPDQPNMAGILLRLGSAHRILARYTEAEFYLKETLRILENISEPDYDPRTKWKCLSGLGIVYRFQLRYAEAESLHKQTLKFCIEEYGHESECSANTLNQLANLYSDQGRYDEAELFYEQGLKIRKKVFGPDHPVLSETLNNLGVIYETQGRYAEAELSYMRALRLREEAPEYGYEHPYLAYPLNNLGELYALQDHYAKADSFCSRALKIVEKAYGPDHLHVAWSVSGLGDTYRWQAEYLKAEQFYDRGLTINRKFFSSVHPKVANSLRKLALLYGSTGEYSKSLANYEELLDSKQTFVENAFAYASEEQKLRYADMHPLVDPSLLSLAQIDTSARSKTIALEMILRGKALVIDAVSAEREIAFCVDDDNILQIERRLGEVGSEISTWSLASIKQPLPEEYRDSLQVLSVIKDSLETQLSRSCSEFREELGARRFTVGEVANALPKGSVLWEFVQYEPYDFKKIGNDKERTGPPRYLSFTLDRAGNISLTDLGDAGEIDSLVRQARDWIYKDRAKARSPMARELERKLSEVTGRLYDIIFAPLESSLGSRRNIFVSPEGQLNLLPFEILPCSDGKYVIEKFSISYLSSGRDLLKFKKRAEPTDWALVMADPDFELSTGELTERKDRISIESSIAFVAPEPARGISSCLDVPFKRLHHSRQEAESISRTFKKRAELDVHAYYAGDALEEVLKGIGSPPKVLHLATHGYFCQDIDLAKNKILENPLLRCGLALAGANRLMDEEQRIDSQSEDGVLTAFEASGLNLIGTELVTLSACETGVGQVKNGEGVYGLRRAFQHAGAQSIVMSLWKVPDKETGELMDDFYKNWSTGRTKKQALRQSALKVLNACKAKYGAAHPLFWGAFVMVGDPN